MNDLNQYLTKSAPSNPRQAIAPNLKRISAKASTQSKAQRKVSPGGFAAIVIVIGFTIANGVLHSGKEAQTKSPYAEYLETCNPDNPNLDLSECRQAAEAMDRYMEQSFR